MTSLGKIQTSFHIKEHILYVGDGHLLHNELTQGSIITNIRSHKYPDVHCYGIVITARCDFAQTNVPAFYLLTAMPIKEWVNKVLPNEIFEKKIKSKRKALIECAKAAEVDIESFIDSSPASFSEKIDKQKQITSQTRDKIKGKYTAWQSSIEEAKLKKKSSISLDTLKNKITAVLHNNVTKTCFIPQYSYYKNPIEKISTLLLDAAGISATTTEVNYDCRKKLQELSLYFTKQYGPFQEKQDLTSGLIVDVLDICCLDIKHKENIEQGNYNYETLNDQSEQTDINLSELFFLSEPGDSVNIAYKIDSPWIEYIMQHFSTAFIRIGVDVASDDEIKKFCKTIMKEWEADK